MIEVVFTRNADDAIEKVSVEGHASYADSGEDIVCAGVSILTISVLNGLEQVAGVTDLKRVVEEGYSSFEVPEGRDFVQGIQISTLIDTFEQGIKATAAAYGDYITVADVIGGETDD